MISDNKRGGQLTASLCSIWFIFRFPLPDFFHPLIKFSLILIKALTVVLFHKFRKKLTQDIDCTKMGYLDTDTKDII